MLAVVSDDDDDDDCVIKICIHMCNQIRFGVIILSGCDSILRFRLLLLLASYLPAN
jgi:hypothetical protein